MTSRDGWFNRLRESHEVRSLNSAEKELLKVFGQLETQTAAIETAFQKGDLSKEEFEKKRQILEQCQRELKGAFDTYDQQSGVNLPVLATGIAATFVSLIGSAQIAQEALPQDQVAAAGVVATATSAAGVLAFLWYKLDKWNALAKSRTDARKISKKATP